VEIFAKAPNQRTWIIQTLDGPSYRVYDGTNAWWAGPDAPAPIEVLTSGNLDRARLETASHHRRPPFRSPSPHFQANSGQRRRVG
jgi:hypothetical protein